MVVSGNTEVLQKTTVTRRVLKGAFCMRVALHRGTRRRLRPTDGALHMHLESQNMGRVNRFACVCVRLSARGSGEPCAMEENERVA